MSGVAADLCRAALVDRFLRPRLAAGGHQHQGPFLPPGAAYFSAQQLADLARDAGAYADGLAGFVHDADAYAAAPADLAAAHARAPGARPAWYFLSPPGFWRGNIPGGGEWVPQRQHRHVEAGGAAVRYARHFFHVNAEKPLYPDGWVMVENGIIWGGGRHGRQEELVLCELYRARGHY
jgi:hypothetical protein